MKKPTSTQLLVIVASIVVLIGAAFIILNSARKAAQERNSQRWDDVNNILTAIHDYMDANDGVLPTGLGADMNETQLGTSAEGCGDCGDASACIDLSVPLAGYLNPIPGDPMAEAAAKTEYSAAVDIDKIVTVRACGAELNEDIVVSRQKIH